MKNIFFNKRFALIGAIAVSASVAFAATVNVSKINHIIEGSIGKAMSQAKVINTLNVGLTKDSVFEGQKPQAGLYLKAGAKKSGWSSRATNLNLLANSNVISRDEQNVLVGLSGKASLNTDAIALYRYIAALLLKSNGTTTPKPGPDADFHQLLVDASTATSLQQIGTQFERGRLIIIAQLGSEYSPWANFLRSLEVKFNEDDHGTIRSVTIENTIPWTDNNGSITKIAFRVSAKDYGISVNATEKFTTKDFDQEVAFTSAALLKLQSLDAETLKQLDDATQMYVQLSDAIIGGQN